MYKIVIEINGVKSTYGRSESLKCVWRMSKHLIRKNISKATFPLFPPIVFVYICKDDIPNYILGSMFHDSYYSLIRSRDLHHIVVRDGEDYE